ncbi:hypothetical protein C2845_PM15G06640 [Panicum miliaceum]|uniref:Uncharacterized protein n=1 Tax=Panicum miliaceum TaxID=4540 RepID=A0A3L6Q9G2_PANMI|nr:hypothetical protein C2845_PM15G06640 [Panicum miliaceum]
MLVTVRFFLFPVDSLARWFLSRGGAAPPAPSHPTPLRAALLLRCAALLRRGPPAPAALLRRRVALLRHGPPDGRPCSSGARPCSAAAPGSAGLDALAHGPVPPVGGGERGAASLCWSNRQRALLPRREEGGREPRLVESPAGPAPPTGGGARGRAHLLRSRAGIDRNSAGGGRSSGCTWRQRSGEGGGRSVRERGRRR